MSAFHALIYLIVLLLLASAVLGIVRLIRLALNHHKRDEATLQ